MDAKPERIQSLNHFMTHNRSGIVYGEKWVLDLDLMPSLDFLFLLMPLDNLYGQYDIPLLASKLNMVIIVLSFFV